MATGDRQVQPFVVERMTSKEVKKVTKVCFQEIVIPVETFDIAI